MCVCVCLCVNTHTHTHTHAHIMHIKYKHTLNIYTFIPIIYTHAQRHHTHIHTRTIHTKGTYTIELHCTHPLIHSSTYSPLFYSIILTVLYLKDISILIFFVVVNLTANSIHFIIKASSGSLAGIDLILIAHQVGALPLDIEELHQ